MPHTRDPVRSTCCSATSPALRRRGPARRAASAPPAAGALRLVADRPGPRAARRGDRRRAAQASPRPGDRLARPASGHHACSKRAASASIRRARTWPASREHIESRVGRHDLHAFQAWRRMDEILARPTSWSSTTRRARSDYDLWIGDEAWELDYYLHENPEQKRAAYVWFTDFVGWLPMPGGGEREAFLTADYNAEMIEHIARFPRVRDRAHLRRRPRRHRPGRLRPRPAADPRLDRAALSTSPATSRASIPRQLADRRGSSATATTSRLHRDGRRFGSGRPSAAAGHRRLPRSQTTGAVPAHDRRRRPAYRPRQPAGVRRSRGAVLRARALSPPGCLRHRRRPGRADHHDGADRGPPAVPVLSARSSLRAELPRPPPAAAVRRRPLHGLPDRDARPTSLPRSPPRSAATSTTGPSPPTAPPAPPSSSPNSSSRKRRVSPDPARPHTT